MELTPERRRCLEVVAAAGGRMNHDEESLAPFCDDASTLSEPDVFNQCHDAGWLFSRHDDRTDSSYVEITQNGRDALSPRMPGIDPKTGEYSTAQMLMDEAYGGDTSQPLFD